jgi:hypothetical protein
MARNHGPRPRRPAGGKPGRKALLSRSSRLRRGDPSGSSFWREAASTRIPASDAGCADGRFANHGRAGLSMRRKARQRRSLKFRFRPFRNSPSRRRFGGLALTKQRPSACQTTCKILYCRSEFRGEGVSSPRADPIWLEPPTAAGAFHYSESFKKFPKVSARLPKLSENRRFLSDSRRKLQEKDYYYQRLA